MVQTPATRRDTARDNFETALDARREMLEGAQSQLQSEATAAESEWQAVITDIDAARNRSHTTWTAQATEVDQFWVGADALQAENLTRATNAADAAHTRYQQLWKNVPRQHLGNSSSLLRTMSTPPAATTFNRPPAAGLGWGAYWRGVGDVFLGYKNAVVNTASGAWQLFRHPIDSTVGIGKAIWHWRDTIDMIWKDIKTKSQTLEGQGELAGDILLILVSGGGLKVAKDAGHLARIANTVNKVVPDKLRRAGKAAAETADRIAPRGTPVFRVQGGTLPNASKIRFALDDAGNIAIRGDDMLYINVNQETRALEFLARRGEGASLVRFELKAEFVKKLHRLAVPQRAGRQFPGRPQLVDLSTPDQFGIPSNMFDELLESIIPGSGSGL